MDSYDNDGLLLFLDDDLFPSDNEEGDEECTSILILIPGKST